MFYNLLGTYKSCSEALLANCFHQAVYPVCAKSLPTPLLIECKLHNKTSSVAVFHHDNENATIVQGYNHPGSYRRVFNYSIPLESIIAVLNQSKSCFQLTKAKCFDAVFTETDSNLDYTWLSDRYGRKLTYWGSGPVNGKGCSCVITKTCASEGVKCNCNSNDQVWRLDKGFIREKNVLPITAINVGDTGDRKEKFIYTVGPLVCYF